MNAPGSAAEFAPALAELWRRHRGANLERVALLESVVAAALRGTLGTEWRQAGETAAHKLAGSLGTFGMAEGSALASGVETMLREHSEDVGLLAITVTDLRAVVEEFGAARSDPPGASDPSAIQVIIATEDPGLRTQLSVEGVGVGWGIEAVDNLGDALAAAQTRKIRLAVADLPAGALAMDLPAEGIRAGDIPAGGQVAASAPVVALASAAPTLVLADRDTVELRLAAAQAGAVGFLLRTAEIHRIVAFAGHLIAEQPPWPTRILVICPDPKTCDYLAGELPGPQFQLVYVSGASGCLTAVRTEQPDAVLVSVARADVDGATVCRVLRADPETRRIPTIVLVPSGDAATVEATMSAGADDLVSRPITQGELQARILARVRRSRIHVAPLASPAAGAPQGDSGAPQGGSGAAHPGADSRHPPSPELVDVAVVEDDESVADVIDYALQFRGLSVHRIGNGLEAAALLTDGTLQARLIVLDVGLPGLDGFGVLTRLREAGILATTPVIVLTARSSEAETLTALGLGATEHMAKPFSVPILLNRVERAMRREEQR